METIYARLQVVIRFLRTPGKPYDLFVKPLYREFLRWQALSHKNISPFYGLVLEHSAVGMAWPLYHNGTVLEYVKAHNDINTLHMEIADGVLYLHAKGIVHGDIRCAHIMVTDTGTPRLINYGLFQVVGLIMAKTGSITTSLPSSIRWSAPETLIADSPVQSKSEKSDVYAFASTCIELILLEEPYQGLSDPQVLKHVLVDGNVLARPSMKIKYSPNDPFWYFLTICWSVRPQERPNIVAFRRKLAEFSNVPTRADGTRKTCFKWPRWSDRTKHVSFSGPT
ncbi:kinase-like domain-containing protein [Gautieria morchelliformis]|nr:kinase-like domain-containing protein [Gautieria morchelliformis]